MVQAFLSSSLKRKHFYRTLMLTALLPLIVWCVGFVLFVRFIISPDFLAGDISQYKDKNYDAIVVVTGGKGRLSTGINLLDNGIAPKMFISGVGQGMDIRRLLKIAKDQPHRLECCVFLGYDATSTVENAIETKTWVQANNIGKILLVTSSYHMSRTVLEFIHAMPDLQLDTYAITSDRVRVEQWYFYPATALLLAKEYSKFLIVKVENGFFNIMSTLGNWVS